MSTDAPRSTDDREPGFGDHGPTDDPNSAEPGSRATVSGVRRGQPATDGMPASTDGDEKGRGETGTVDVRLTEPLDHTTEDADADPSLGDRARRSTSTPRMSFADRVRTTDRVQLLIVGLIGIALVFFVRGLTLGVTGSDRYQLRAGIESVLPVPESVQVNASQSVVVDLEPLSTGILIIDGVELETVNLLDFPSGPGVQVDLPPVTIFEPGNATLTFTPSRDAAITSFEPGEHTVEVRYWKEADGPQRARSYTWNFRAA